MPPSPQPLTHPARDPGPRLAPGSSFLSSCAASGKSRGDHAGARLNGRIAAVRRIFEEQNVHYTVDGDGGVHFQFDEQFAKDRAAAIESLQGDRYANARNAFDGGMEAFSKAPPDGKNAVRGVFSAAENVFKLMTSKDRLGANEADALGPIIDKAYAADVTARQSARKMLRSL